MQTNENLNKRNQCEEALVAIGDLAKTGSRLQEVLSAGLVSGRVADACNYLFTEIADLAGSADPANVGSDT